MRQVNRINEYANKIISEINRLLQEKKPVFAAIDGRCGAGKTTLGEKLSTRLEISIPRHCTTRSRRTDDQEGFYRYLTHEKYNELLQQRKFLISSGDGPEVKKEYEDKSSIVQEQIISAISQIKSIEKEADLKIEKH